MNPLVAHAYQNVWCNPRQDRQAVFKPARISPPQGARREVDSLWDSYALPTIEHAYHVYQIGQVDPVLLGLPELAGQWVSLASQMQAEKLIARVYTAAGVMFPVSTCYVMITNERVLLLAVRDQPRVANLRATPIFFWVYSNAYYESDRSDTVHQEIVVRSVVYSTQDESVVLINDAERLLKRQGRVLITVNGRAMWPMPWADLKPGDVLELVYDSSVAQTLTFPVSAQPAFDSTMDLKRKLLLHPTVALDPSIWYRDDIEIYLTRTTNGIKRGVFFHRNEDASLRQLTHADWSILSSQLTFQAGANPELGSLDGCVIEMVLRNSGYDRPLVDEAQRIRDLYTLPLDLVGRAMLGVDSTVPLWRADSLEASNYPKLMGALDSTITQRMVEDAYGYNALSRIAADSPLPLVASEGRFTTVLPYGLQADATMYEYDANGLLLGRNIHALGETYAAQRASARMIEGITGIGGWESSTLTGYVQYYIDPALEHAFYITPIVGGVPDPHGWVDVTGDTTKYGIVNDRVVWLTDFEDFYVAVRIDGRRFLASTLSIASSNGRLGFTITADVVWEGDVSRIPQPIPTGVLELWLNGQALVEDIDYYVQWPQVVICNKQYLRDAVTQVVEVRATGLCRPDMTRVKPEQIGFVDQGLLSRDEVFTTRNDRVLRVSIGGRVIHRSQLVFDEDGPLGTDAKYNGRPYALSSPPVPIPGLTQPVRPMRVKARADDALVSAYLTAHRPTVVRPNTPNPIPERYAVVSPFCAAVLHDLRLGRLSLADFRGQYSNQDVFEYLQPTYGFLLDFDPCLKATDDRYLSIHPHERQTVLELDLYQYNFLTRAIHVFLNDRVDLTRFVAISDALTEA